MNSEIEQFILEITNARTVMHKESVQSLWSGYGSIDRYRLAGGNVSSVVVKHVQFPHNVTHPRGWDSDRSDQRKRRSYAVETQWYENWARRCDNTVRIPQCLGMRKTDNEVLMVMEDLVDSGFSRTLGALDRPGMNCVLEWLANFHATFMGEAPDGLWQVGTYWHLDTRPDELEALDDERLKRAATKLDTLLTNAPYQTFVHGDAKLANFCFSNDLTQVAAVDFQYVGGGCGMKDVAYFVGSCLDETECARHEATLLRDYFDALKQALARHRPEIDADAVEKAWRPLYRIAWTDFFRFLQGWSPGHWKIHDYSARVADEVLSQLPGS